MKDPTEENLTEVYISVAKGYRVAPLVRVSVRGERPELLFIEEAIAVRDALNEAISEIETHRASIAPIDSSEGR